MTGCDNCHVVAVIGPYSADIRDALEMLRAVPLELRVANTTVWLWSQGTCQGTAQPQERTVPSTATHVQRQIPDKPAEPPSSVANPTGEDGLAALAGGTAGGQPSHWRTAR
jgi:hypothetical protein